MNNTRTLEDIFYEIKDYFENNDDKFTAIIEELDREMGILNGEACWPMSEFECVFDAYRQRHGFDRAMDLIYWGEDDEDKVYDSLGKEGHSTFNPNAEYFYIDDLERLHSTSTKDYSSHLDDYFIETFLDYFWRIDDRLIDDELEELVLEYEALEEEAE